MPKEFIREKHKKEKIKPQNGIIELKFNTYLTELNALLFL